VAPQEYDDLLRTLVRTLAHQESINQDLRASITELRKFNRQQTGINERLTAAIERLDTTQARIETLLARLIRSEHNGREA
jgi:hypothetical protein